MQARGQAAVFPVVDREKEWKLVKSLNYTIKRKFYWKVE